MSKLTVWFVGSQVKAAGVVDMLIGLDGSFAVERVDVADASFRLKPADVERLRAARATVVLLVTPEFADSMVGVQRAMVALSAAAAAGDVLVIPVYCRHMADTESLPCQSLSWMPGKLQPLSALPNPDETVKLVCEQIAVELAAFSAPPAAALQQSDAAPALPESEPDVAVFCAAADDKLVAHDMGNVLRILKRRGVLRQDYGTWQEAPDGDWNERRDRARRAPFVVIMISADLLADDYYWEFISSGLQPHQKVLCVYLRACDYGGLPGTKSRVVPHERGAAYPIAGPCNKDEAWHQVLVALQRLLENAA